MEIERVSVLELVDELAVEWDRLRPAQSTFSSPFYSSGYARLVAAERPHVEAGLVRERGRLRAVMAYERSGGSAIPVGGGISDFQGPVVPTAASNSRAIDSRAIDSRGADEHAELALEPIAWLRALRLDTWRFRYVPPVWKPLAPYRFFQMSSPFVDLSDGFATFKAAIDARGSDMMHRHTRGCRTFAKRLGPVRFEFDNREPALLERFLGWKAAQHAERGTRFAFAEPWAKRLVERAFESRDEAFRGTLSCLFAGDHFVAGSYNLISGGTLHVWTAAFGPEYSKFSPGTNFFPELIMAAGAAGIKRLDFGHGDEPFKYRFGTCQDDVAEGCVDRRLLIGWATRGS
ncbi:MAG: GNAT family N-acetyltransferase, partial [Planctomycetota bacterium]